MDGSKLRDLNLSNDEISRLEKAFGNNQFRDLFTEYLKDIHNPENQKVFEKEIVELEKQRGNDVVLIKPTPYYVIKTSVQGNTKAYINFAYSNRVNKLSYVPAEKDSMVGINVSLPYSLSPVRRTYDKSNQSCNVYCVVFHPETLKEADKNDALKKAVQQTAFSAIEKSLSVQLDKVNFRTSKKTSKGPLEMTMVKKNGSTDLQSDTFAIVGENNQELKSHTDSDYVTPIYKIKYRNEMDLQNSTTDKYCKMNILIPKQMIIEIHLPLLKSIQNTQLDVHSTSLELKNNDPKYKLQLVLPYEVNEDSGRATFNAESRILTLELDVKKKNINVRNEKQNLIEEISSVDTLSSDLIKPCNGSASNSNTTEMNEVSFLNPDIKYKLPTYICNYHNNILAFTLKVKNVVSSSFEEQVFEKGDGFWVKFNSLGSGHFPMHYSMRISFTECLFQTTDAFDCKIEDDNVFLYLHLKEGSHPLEYMVGVDSIHMQKTYLNEADALMLQFEKKDKPENLNLKLEVTDIDAEKVVINMRTADDVKENGSPQVKEELLFDNQNPSNPKFETLFDNFHTRLVFDEKSLSESELLKQTNSTMNGSWVTERKPMRKTKRKSLVKKSLNEKNVMRDDTAKAKDDTNVLLRALEVLEKIDDEEEINEEGGDCNAVSQAIDIRSAYRYSDLSARSILKKNRSFSESSGDESLYMNYSRSYSVDEINYSPDSYSTSCPKKTVTFNDVISKKLFSSDISILEQRKRQKRRKQRKVRRASDSENSESEGNGTTDERRENIRIHNETLLSTSETELTSSLSESGGETSDDQSESVETAGNDIRRPAKKQQPVPSSKKSHKKHGKKSARKNASTAKHQQHHEDALF